MRSCHIHIDDRSKRNEAKPLWLATRRLRREEHGIALASVVMLGAALLILTTVVTANMLATIRAVGRDRGWEQAIHIAEGGVDDIFRAIDASETVNQAPVGTPLATKEEVVAAAAAFPVTASPEGEFVNFTNSDGDKVYAVGYQPERDNGTVTVRAIEVEYLILTDSVFTFPNAAVVADDDVMMSGNGDTATDPFTEHQAHVYANGDFNGNGNTYVDGDISAAGTASGGTAYGSSTSGAPPVEFPDQADIDAWQAQLEAEAQTGATYGAITSSQIIIAPAYINGDIDLSGNKTVTLVGPGVIYVEGMVDLSGPSKIVNSQVVMAVRDEFDMSGQSRYEVTGDITLAELVSFSTTSDAIKIVGGGSAVSMGTFWAANGGAKLSGNGAFFGAVQAADDVTISGNGGVLYPADLNENSQVGIPVPDKVVIGRQREP